MSDRATRRTVLRAAGAAVALPLLEAAQPRAFAWDRAAATRRLAYLYIPNGVAEGAWHPERVSEDGRIERLNAWMAPLEPFRERLTLFRNLWTPRGNGHAAGTATWLTGGGFDRERIDVGGPSADQIAARHLAAETLLPSLDLSVRGEGFFSHSLPRNTLSWADGRTPVPRDIEPSVVFDRLFGAAPAGGGSVLDAVREDARRLERRASSLDRRVIDEYLTAVRSVERRIAFADRQRSRADGPVAAAMVRPEPGIPVDHGAYVRSMMDLIVLAFWADATRVCTFMLDHGQSNRYFDFIDGVRGTWHALSHHRDISGETEDDDGVTRWSSRAEKRDMYNRVTRWHTEQVAYLLGRLEAIAGPTGDLLDSSLVVYGSSLADGHAHAEEDLPVLLAGRGAATVRSGRVVGGRRATSMSDLHLALLRRVGVPVRRFAESTKPLDL